MPLPNQEVEKIAHLARIALNEQDIPLYAHHLSNILTLVEQMNSLDTMGIAPLAHPLETKIRLRPDLVSETDQRDHFQQLAPQVEMGLYLVPKVIE